MNQSRRQARLQARALNARVTNLHQADIIASFHHLPKQERLQYLSNLSLSISTFGIEDLNNVFNQLRRLGFTSIRIAEILLCMAYLINAENIILPSGKKNKQQRGIAAQGILERMRLQANDQNELDVYATIFGTEQNIRILAENEAANLASLVQSVAADTMILGKVIDYLRSYVKQFPLLAVEQSNPTQIPIHGSRITLKTADVELKGDVIKKTDRIVIYTAGTNIKRLVMQELITHAAFDLRRYQLEQAIHNGEITTIPKFTLDRWPYDPLMRLLRQDVRPFVQEYITSTGAVCDPQDLKYQTLFRLTTFDVAEVFEKGDELEEYLHKIGAYKNWRNLLLLDPAVINRFKLNGDLVRKVIAEQYLIIRDRLAKSKLPLNEMLRPNGIFAEQGWVIQRRTDGFFAVQEESGISISEGIPLEFREVDPSLANQFHNDLHYIHTPRADKAFALFIQGEVLPFSIVALEAIDRPYKQNALLAQGYDPRKCYDLTRLYSKPGTPGNTSSSMFALAFGYLRTQYPETQAILSSFMPSYATGVSMTSGGFDNPVLVKPLMHTFVERTIDGITCYEHVTNRRMGEAAGKKIWSRFPFLPTIELLSAIQSTRFTPITGVDKWMIEIF